MRHRGGLAWGMILLLAAPAAVAAQGRSCSQVRPADFRRLFNLRGEEVLYFRDPIRLECTGSVTLEADSAVYNRSVQAMELIGSVVYQDSTHRLTSGWANYLGSLEQVLARRDVVLTDLLDGSVVTGQELQYLRETATRPVSQVVMRGGRPRAVLRDAPATDPAPADTAAPVEITADRLEFLGDTLFTAQGRVDIVRGETTGQADSARYDQPGEQLTLLGRAHVRNPEYRLEGERIDAWVRGEELREVTAEVRTSLISEDLRVRSERLRIGFVGGELDRLEAWNPGPAPGPAAGAAGDTLGGRTAATADAGRAGPGRAVALAEGFRLYADSIEARAEGGVLREVRAVRRAYGERRLDSLAVALPDLIARDWIQGDTIIGYFAEAAAGPAPADTAALPPADGGGADSTEIVLERVVVVGVNDPALSLYRMEPENGERGAINFMQASRIILFLIEGEVARVEAEGPIEGVYLDPVRQRTNPVPDAAAPVGGGAR